ncbi:hypothetical protein ABH966_005102 [Lysinibacillus sp. RC46]
MFASTVQRDSSGVWALLSNEVIGVSTGRIVILSATPRSQYKGSP